MVRILASMAAVAALLLTISARAAPPSVEDALKDRVLGDPNAPIEIVEYGALTCEDCRKFHLIVFPELKKKYIDTGKVKLVYREYPANRADLLAALLARCAPPERFFTFLDVLFQNVQRWAGDPDHGAALSRIGRLGGLSEDDYRACVRNQRLVDGLVKTRADAKNLFDINVAPTFVINGDKRVTGFQEFEVFDELLEKLTK